MNAHWFKYLPGPVRSRLHGRHGLQAVLGNSSWLFGDKIVRMVVGLLVGIWIVRYLGPTQLGLLSYAGAFAGLFGSVAALGLDSIVIRELVKDPQRQPQLLGSAFVLKLVAGIVAMVAAGLTIAVVRDGDRLTLFLVVLSASVFLFQPLNVVDFYFQSRMQSRYTVYATTSAFLVMTCVKVALLLLAAPLIAFAWAGLAEAMLAAGFLIVAYRANHQQFRMWRYDRTVARELLSQSWPLILSGLAIMVYMRIDQIMIGQMLGDKEVGLFSAAIRISEMWYFVPMALASSVFPKIIESKKLGDATYYARLQTFFTVMTWLAIGMAVVVTLAKDLIVGFLLGKAYTESATVLAIHIWAGVFLALGVASSGWFIVEGLQKYSFYRTLTGGIVNVLLNLILIPKFGINGAAMATVIAQGSAGFIFDLSNGRTRRIFWMKVRAFNPLSALSGSSRGS